MSYLIIKFAPGCQLYFVSTANCVTFFFHYRIDHNQKSARYQEKLPHLRYYEKLTQLNHFELLKQH